jgi:TorA maturation chaperone TorD
VDRRKNPGLTAERENTMQDDNNRNSAKELPTASLPEMDAITLLARGNIYLNLARALAYPSDEILNTLVMGPFLDTLQQASDAIGTHEATEIALERIASATKQLSDSPLHLREEHTYLFARQVQASPYGTNYGSGLAFAQMRDREELAGYYKAFGFQMAARHPELHDHISVEMEFAGVLSAKEAYAIDTGQSEAATICREARARFVGTHLCDWLPKFADRLEASARLDFYPAIVSLAVAMVQEEPVVVQPRAPISYPDTWDTDEDEFTCGAIGEQCLSAME